MAKFSYQLHRETDVKAIPEELCNVIECRKLSNVYKYFF